MKLVAQPNIFGFNEVTNKRKRKYSMKKGENAIDIYNKSLEEALIVFDCEIKKQIDQIEMVPCCYNRKIQFTQHYITKKANVLKNYSY